MKIEEITIVQMERIQEAAQAQLEAEYREMGARKQPPTITLAIVRIILAAAREAEAE